jgi:periplasmic divalent cation tolerance protein
MAADAVIVTTTIDDRGKAKDLARGAVLARLAACGQVGGPITSTYWWQGEVEDTEEWTVAFKTTTDRSEALVEHLKQAHSYDVPEILVTPVTGGNDAYLGWVAEETRPR